MSLLDLVLLVAGVATALVAPARWAVAMVAAVAAAQAVWEGVTWHFAPLYGLLLAVALWPGRRTRGVRASRALLAALAVAPWLLAVPVPTLPTPRGPHAVGTQPFRWLDTSRAEGATPEPSDRRQVVVQAWYPAVPGSSRSRVPYLDGLGRLPAVVSGLPSVIMQHYGRIDTHAQASAAPASGRWPLVVFLPGYGAPRAVYTSMVADLASRGFVVLAVDHPYEAAVTELANGQLATLTERFDPRERDRTQFMARQQAVRAADVAFVLDRALAFRGLGALTAHVDTARVAVVGHSFGGAAATLVATEDARVHAAANIDGTLYGDLPTRSLDRPLLLLESDHRGTPHAPRYLEGHAQLLRQTRAAAYRFELHGANHYTFTDLPFLFAPPARRLLMWWLGGTREAAATQRAVADMLVAFLAASSGAVDSVDAVARGRGPISGGRAAVPGGTIGAPRAP